MYDYLDWLFDEFDHGFSMNAPLYLPAGSTLADLYSAFRPVPSLFPRLHTAKEERE